MAKRRSKLEVLEEKLKIKEAEAQLKLLTAAESFVLPDYNSGNNRFDQIPDYAWYGTGAAYYIPRNKRGDLPQAYLNEEELRMAREKSRYASITSEFARNCLTVRQNYIVGKGLQTIPEPRDEDTELPEALEKEVKDFIREFEAINAWGLKTREAVFRGDRDGEAFLRLFRAADGTTLVRFVEPEFVSNWGGTTPYGVIISNDDTRTVEGYLLKYDPAEDVEEVPETDIVHVKCNTDSGIRRGLPFLYPILGMLDRIEKLDANISTLIAIQASIALIRKHQMARASAIDAKRQSEAGWQQYDATVNQQRYYKQYLPGQVLDTDAQTEYEFPAAGVSIPGFTAGKESMLRTAAAGACMPEYMFTSDASNGNFASSQVAESPAMANFSAWQAWWALHLGSGVYYPEAPHGVLWRAIEWAVKCKKISPAVLDTVLLDSRGPDMSERDRGAETNRLKTLHDDGIISGEQRATGEGYRQPAKSDEERQAEKEREAQAKLKMSAANSGASGGGAAY